MLQRRFGNLAAPAEWNVMEPNRPYPQSWRCDEFRAEGAASGVAFVLPANSYQLMALTAKMNR